jgi:medium-chain acyl-[acyl-carrier-protein] hydrolase
MAMTCLFIRLKVHGIDGTDSMKNSFTRAFTVSSYDLNPKGQARLTTLANYFQEMAYHHANQLGFGYEDMNEQKIMWVLSRMRIRINHYPVWDDQLSVETWHKGMNRLFGLRDFRVKNTEGEVLGLASSAWLILDSKTRRPIRPAAGVLSQNLGTDSVFEENLDKIHLPDQMEELARRSVQFSDLDIVGHVNNVKYMEWCIDALMDKGSIHREIRELEINFMHEALLGDSIIIRGTLPESSASDGSSVFMAKREGDDQEIIRARLLWD